MSLDPVPARGGSLHRILGDSTFYLLGNIAARGAAFLAIPIYARFLSPAQYGLIELIELSTQTAAIAVGLQAVGMALTRVSHDHPGLAAQRSVASTALVGTAVLSGALTAAGCAGAGALSQAVFGTPEWATLLQAAFIAMFLSSQMELALVIERMRGHAGFSVAYSLISLACTLGLNILFIGGLQYGVWGFVSSKLIVSGGGAAFLFWRQRRSVGWGWHGAYVPEFLRFGAPLIVSGLSYFAVHFSDRFFLAPVVPLAELGRYALAYKFAMMVNALVGESFEKSWTVHMYRGANEAEWKEGFARVAAWFTFVLAVGGLSIAAWGPELLRVMVPPDFQPPPFLLPLLVLAYVLRDVGDFFRSLLLINKRSLRVGQVALGAAALNVAANAVIVPAYGVYGAAWATLVTWSAHLVVCWGLAQREHRLPVRRSRYALLLALLVLAGGGAAGWRVPGFVEQVLLDALWVGGFTVAGALVFLTAAERQLAARQLRAGLARPMAWVRR